MPEVNETITAIEWALQNAVGDVLAAFKRDGQRIGVEAVVVGVVPHENGEQLRILTAVSTGRVVEAAIGKVERDEGPVDIAADFSSGELTLP